MKYAVMKQAVVAAAKEGKRKHDALESEKVLLLERLEKKAREDAVKAEEARQALEKGGGGEEERTRLEARLLQEREEASNEKRKLLLDLESKILEEKRKREEDLEERDRQLESVKSEKVAAEEKFELFIGQVTLFRHASVSSTYPCQSVGPSVRPSHF